MERFTFPCAMDKEGHRQTSRSENGTIAGRWLPWQQRHSWSSLTSVLLKARSTRATNAPVTGESYSAYMEAYQCRRVTVVCFTGARIRAFIWRKHWSMCSLAASLTLLLRRSQSRRLLTGRKLSTTCQLSSVITCSGTVLQDTDAFWWQQKHSVNTFCLFQQRVPLC